MSNEELVVLGGVRTPFGRFGGSLRDIDCYDLGAMVMRECLKRLGLPGSAVDEVFWGAGDTSCCKDVYTPVIARQSLLKAGLPPETVSCTIDKACVSATSALILGARAIRCGDAAAVLAGGVTTFSRDPLLLRGLRWQGSRMGPAALEDPLHELGYKDYNPVAVDAGEVAVEHGVTREQQDSWAVESHRKYGAAHAAGKFQDEIMPLEIPSKEGAKVLDIDEQYRADVTLEKLARLKPIYGSPTCTAGNAPGLNDGAAALLLSTRSKAKELGLKPLASIVAAVSVAAPARLLSESPARAAWKALQVAGLKKEDIKLWEINEAFAAVTLVSSLLLGEDPKGVAKLRENLNVNGGAIAIGHANTASGARLVLTLAHELRRRGGGYGLLAICGGLAQGDAVLIKVEA